MAHMTAINDRRRVAEVFRRFGDVIRLDDADQVGLSRDAILRQEQRGELRRVGKSAFVPTELDDAGSAWQRLRYRALGFALCGPDDAYLTGPAAALLWGLPNHGNPPVRPTTIRPGNPHVGHTATKYGRTRHGHLPAGRRAALGRIKIVDPIYCAVDVARHRGAAEGLMVADAALHRTWRRRSEADLAECDPDVSDERIGMARLTESMTAYPGITTARWVAEHADARTESPLESLGRFAFLAAGRPAPISNPWICVHGRVFRVDHLLAETGVVLEADGALKYDSRPDAGALVLADREREGLLRSAGYPVVRYSWSTAINAPDTLVRRADEAGRGRMVPPPTSWSMEPPWWTRPA